MTKALYAGSFDPFTIGHKSIVDRGLAIFDRIIIGIGINSDKTPLFTPKERLDQISALYNKESRIEVITYSGLTADTARALGCTHLLRGVRNSIDADYERQLADANRNISGLESVILYTLPEHSFISSSLIRDLIKNGQSVAPFIP